MRILFRTDASSEIGSGHVMRCLTLAKVLRAHGTECVFACREHNGNLIAHIQRERFETINLPIEIGKKSRSSKKELAHADWLGSDWSKDAEQIISATRHSKPDWLVVDHYALDIRWQSSVRSNFARIMVIDDLADRRHDCDLLLDQNLVAGFQHRYDNLVPSHCDLFLGPEYALLGPEYVALHKKTPFRTGKINQILVYFDAADNFNLTGRTVSAFQSLERDDLNLNVVINPMGQHANKIREQAKSDTKINIRYQPC